MNSYKRYEVINAQPALPPWSTQWVGVDGCGSATVSYGSPITFTQPPPNTLTENYEPVKESLMTPTKRKGLRTGYPPYRYTPYNIGRVTKRQFLVRRKYGTAGLDVYYQYGYVGREGGSTCHRVTERIEHTGPLYSSWYQVQHDYTSYSNYVQYGFDSNEVSQAIASVHSQLAVKSISTYDSLTELAELKQVPPMLMSMTRDILSILRGMRGRFGYRTMRDAAKFTVRDLLKHPDKVFRKLGDEWMTYRYGIMPILYSCRDIMKLMDRGVDAEERCSETISPHDLGVTLPGPGSTYRRTRIAGDIVIRGCSFQHFTSAEVARHSGMGFNPFVTAWELIPYSFVVDWFVNAGDYIAAKTGASFAQQKWACLSRRDKYTTWVEVHLPNQDQTIPINNRVPTGWNGSQPSSPPPVVLSNPEGYFPVESEEVDSYSRWIVDLSDVPLVLKPSMNWRRWLDSAVLSLNTIRNFLK